MGYQLGVKEKVRDLRKKGLSLYQIKERTSVPVTTIRTWIQDITLSAEQKKLLEQRIQTALQQGRIRAQSVFREQRLQKEKMLTEKGKEEISSLTRKEFFVAGVALYWAEGFKNKHEHRLGFCNSDPGMIRFYVEWLRNTLSVNKKDLVVRLTINVSYKEKVREIEKYWSKAIGISPNQFTKPFYQNTIWKKQYGNIETYHGVLRIHVKDSLDHLLRMKGWIEGLKMNQVI